MSEHKQKEELLRRFKEECAMVGDEPLGVALPLMEWIGLFGIMQLALRHPTATKSPTAAAARQFILAFKDNLPPELVATRRIIEYGFHRKFDEKPMNENGKCRVCGCTNTTACQTPTGPCYWVEADLCSACAAAARSVLP